MLIVWFFVYKKLAQFAVRCALPPRRSESPVCATDNKPSWVLHLLGWFIGSRGFSSMERRPEFWVLQFQDDSAASHLLWTLFLILLHQLHLRSPGIRSQRLGTLNLGYKMKLNWMVKQKQGQSQRMNQTKPPSDCHYHRVGTRHEQKEPACRREPIVCRWARTRGHEAQGRDRSGEPGLLLPLPVYSISAGCPPTLHWVSLGGLCFWAIKVCLSQVLPSLLLLLEND